MSENKMYTPSLEEQLVKTGLNMPENWKGDLRPLWVEMFEPLIEGTHYEFSVNNPRLKSLACKESLRP